MESPYQEKNAYKILDARAESFLLQYGYGLIVSDSAALLVEKHDRHCVIRVALNKELRKVTVSTHGHVPVHSSKTTFEDFTSGFRLYYVMSFLKVIEQY